MASGVYRIWPPNGAASWTCPPTPPEVAQAIANWDAFELEEAATASGLPVCVVRTSGRMARPRAGSASRRATGHRTRAHRRRAGPGLRTSGATLRRDPGPVVHPRCRRPYRRSDARRARSRRAVRHPTQRLRARVHLRRSQRRFPQRLHRPRQSQSANVERLRCSPTPTSWSTTTALARWSVADSTPTAGSISTRVSCTYRSPATGPPARGRGAAAST